MGGNILRAFITLANVVCEFLCSWKPSGPPLGSFGNRDWRNIPQGTLQGGIIASLLWTKTPWPCSSPYEVWTLRKRGIKQLLPGQAPGRPSNPRIRAASPRAKTCPHPPTQRAARAGPSPAPRRLSEQTRGTGRQRRELARIVRKVPPEPYLFIFFC